MIIYNNIYRALSGFIVKYITYIYPNDNEASPNNGELIGTTIWTITEREKRHMEDMRCAGYISKNINNIFDFLPLGMS